MQKSPHKQTPLTTSQKPNANLTHKTNGLHSPGSKSPKSSNNLSSVAEDPNTDPPSQNANQKKKKKKKRRHSEMEGDVETFTSPPPLTQSSPAEAVSAKRCKKKKKKRKHESDDGEELKARECVQSHLNTSHQEDWCQSGIWSLTSHSDAESKQKAQVSATSTTQHESHQNEQEQASVKKKKKKKRKKKKRIELQEALQEINSTCSTSERWVVVVLSPSLPPHPQFWTIQV